MRMTLDRYWIEFRLACRLSGRQQQRQIYFLVLSSAAWLKAVRYYVEN